MNTPKKKDRSKKLVVIKNKKKPEALNRYYLQRIGIVQKGKQAYRDKDYQKAIVHYYQYIEVLSGIKDVEEKNIGPHLFDPNTELMEIIMLNSIYWDLAKIYDRSPSLRKEFLRCLNQFYIFTINLPSQHINIRIMKKFMRDGSPKNKKDFHKIYKRIYRSSKLCYLADHCFGPHHSVTSSLRDFKGFLLNYKIGHVTVASYYRYSPKIVLFFNKHPMIDFWVTRFFVRPLLQLFALMWKACDINYRSKL